MERIQQMATNNTTKRFLAGALTFFLLFVFILPILIFADVTKSEETTGLVKCGIATTSTGLLANPCDFTDFIGLINGIIDWIIGIATSIFTIMAVYGGFLYMTSGENPGNKAKAKSILWNTILGFVIILTSWLIVYTILNTLIPNDGTSTYRKSIFQFIGNGN